MVEIYSISDNTNNYDVESVDLYDPISIYMLQILNIMNGSTGSVMGALNMPVDLAHYVYETGVDEKQLENTIVSSLEKYSPFYKDYRTDIKVRFLKGTARDICMIDFVIDAAAKFTFKIY